MIQRLKTIKHEDLFVSLEQGWYKLLKKKGWKKRDQLLAKLFQTLLAAQTFTVDALLIQMNLSLIEVDKIVYFMIYKLNIRRNLIALLL